MEGKKKGRKKPIERKKQKEIQWNSSERKTISLSFFALPVCKYRCLATRKIEMMLLPRLHQSYKTEKNTNK
jgi:hypothetical protein